MLKSILLAACVVAVLAAPPARDVSFTYYKLTLNNNQQTP